ncbi:hypothetical protein SEA_LILMAC1015_64 [Arthrobacter phage Lilmac1015]|uniref:Uncharacterized protein n=1 Tax=Arthrobacter phage Lilmac1015 TaxID=2912653 RepID=A0AA49BPH8_9CAUD|nr:hypothetical protein SEA_LILMAC1015_64 [Arthrobacter phage Lilmac1015]
MIRLCPSCIARRARLVAEDCPVCEGAGVLRLGPAALKIHDPDVVSRASAIVLEAVARRAEEIAETPADAVPAVRAAVGLLVESGLLAGPEASPLPRVPGAGRTASPATLAAAASPVPVLPVDWILTEAPAYHYLPGDRPNARGLPVLSDDGHPSHLARVTDPAEPGASTAEAARHRKARARHAATLATAVPHIIEIKRAKENA